MSNKGIFTAVSGAVAQQTRMDSIANNVANVNTPAFKKDKQVFEEYLTSKERPPDLIQVPKVPASIESFYDMQGGDKSYVAHAGTYTDFTQGNLKPTGNNLDIALEGNAFFEVLTPQGVRVTRNGSFKIDNQGRLVTKEGHPVLSQGVGQPPEARVIQVENANLTVSHRGDIYTNGQFLNRFSLVTVESLDALQKAGGSLYSIKQNAATPLVPAQEVQTHQGFLEGSNVNIVSEMTDMIAAHRVFESTQKAVRAFDQMNDKLVNEVGRTS